MPKSTEELENELKTVQTTEELMDWLDENKKKESFSIYLRQLCHQHETELSKLANEVALSKIADLCIGQWFQKSKKGYGH